MTRESGPVLDLSAHTRSVGKIQSKQRALGPDAADAMAQRLALPEVEDTIGTHQRHQLRVPTTETADGTVMSVGRRQDARNYDGFGLTTVAHVAVSAEGGKAESTATFQSNGQLLIQSDQDSAYVVSKGPSVLASASVANVVASGGVVIAAGGGVSVKNAAIEGEAPDAPEALSAHADLMKTAAADWDTWSGNNETVAADRDTLQDSADPDHKTEWAAHQADVTGKDLASATHADNNELGADASSEAGGLAFYGEAGFLLGSPAFGAVHAETALTLSSAFPAITATDSLDLSAAKDAAMTAGGNVGIIAAAEARVVANEGDLHLASRTGDKAELWAKAVHLGELSPDAPQTETETVSARAKKRISLATDKDGGRDEGDDGIYLETHELIEGKADTTITLEAGETATVKVLDEDIQIIVDSGGEITIDSDGTKLVISDSDGLVFGDDQDDYLTASSDAVFAGVDSDNCIEISSSEVAIKGSSIEIG